MSELISVTGPSRLQGSVALSGAKNAALPIIVASTLVGGTYSLNNVPELVDVSNLLSVLGDLGVDSAFADNRLQIDSTKLIATTAGKESARKIRYSLLLMGALLARTGHVRVAPPGGCKLGLRKYDLHLYGLQKLGAQIDATEDYIDLRAPNGLRGEVVDFYFASMTATENVMLAAVLAKGTTVITNAQQDPEVVDFAHFLNAMGAKVDGAGTHRITIEGVDALHSVDYEIMPDRMELVTLAAASAITGCPIFIRKGRLPDIAPESEALSRMGVELEQTDAGVQVAPPQRLKATDVEALISPHVHSDVQPFFTLLGCLADGTSRVTDLLYDGRFLYVPELAKMGADISIETSDRLVPSGQNAQTAVVRSVDSLRAADVTATDIRGGAALLVAALAANGTTTINNVEQIDRGYERLNEKLSWLGAVVSRSDD